MRPTRWRQSTHVAVGVVVLVLVAAVVAVAAVLTGHQSSDAAAARPAPWRRPARRSTVPAGVWPCPAVRTRWRWRRPPRPCGPPPR
ncbi:hypothetical protein [Mycolicibacterium houstonense]|uniref:hypothetical protein n=1 Tax=Mycolicibacterium houstonense TaxID=146021 RepID=UPI003F4920B1